MLEEWVQVRDFPTYLISNYGRLYDHQLDIIPNSWISDWGYVQVSLRDEGGKYKTKTVHRLVAQHFVPGEDVRLEVNHKDGNKLNNFETNLEWVTKGENNTHALKTGLRKPRGVAVVIRETGQRFESVKECAQVLEIYPTTVSALANGRLASYKGIHIDHVD